MAIEKNEVGIT